MNDVFFYLQKLLKKNDIIVVGASAGPDSMFLLHLLNDLKEKLDLKVIVAHVNHKLRRESDSEKEFVEKYAVANNFIFESKDIKEYLGKNLEDEARKIRYDFFEELISKYQAKYLLTAHHGDDLVETILMRLVRGSSLKGYSGFQREGIRDNYVLVRPLITLTKEDIVKYMNDNKLKYFIDQSNYDLKYTRNRYRHNILPLLKKEDALVHLKFNKFSEELAQVNAFLDDYIKLLVKDLKTEKGYLIVKILELEDFLIKKVIEYEFSLVYEDDLYLISDRHIMAVLNLIKSTKSNGVINLPNDYIARKDYNYWKICYNRKREVFEKRLEEETVVPTGIIRKVVTSESKSNYVIRLNSKDLEMPLIVRSRLDGDIMEVKNLNGRKKVKDILIDEKVSWEKRELFPVVTDSKNTIIWLPGVKKSKFDVETNGIYDIILAYEEEYNEH